MKTFFSYVSVVLAALIIWAGCDSLFTPNSDDELRNHDFGFITSIRVDVKTAESLGKLQDSIRDIVKKHDNMLGLDAENLACLRPRMEREDLDALRGRVNALLGRVDDGLTIDNFYDRMEDLDSTQWARFDSSAFEVILQDRLNLRSAFDAACPEDGQWQELAQTVFEEYADIISQLSTTEIDELVESALSGYATDPIRCSEACERKREAGKAAASLTGVGGVAGCAKKVKHWVPALGCAGIAAGVAFFGIEYSEADFDLCLMDCGCAVGDDWYICIGDPE